MTSLTDSTAWLSVSLVDQHEKLLSTQVSVYRGAGMSWSFCKNAQHKLFQKLEITAFFQFIVHRLTIDRDHREADGT